jgi:hypothetical protein
VEIDLLFNPHAAGAAAACPVPLHAEIEPAVSEQQTSKRTEEKVVGHSFLASKVHWLQWRQALISWLYC